MDWFYVQMVQTHALVAWITVGIFAVRGAAALFDASWRMDYRLLAIVFLAYLLLVISGLSLWALMHHNPIYDGWLAGKLIALIIYAFCAHWAVSDHPYRAVGYGISLLMLAYAVSAATTRQGLLGL